MTFRILALFLLLLLVPARALSAGRDWMEPEVARALRGRMLSMFDASDDRASSCAPAFAQAKGLLVREEVVLKLGTGHAAFYRPGEWIGQVVEWIRKAKDKKD